MRKIALAVLGISLAASAFSQQLVRNPARPLDARAGRVLEVERVLEISDASGDFYFKYPYRFDLDDRGCLYVLDEGQLLKFSPEGRFLGNLYKKGQGPGEIASPFHMVSFFCHRDGLYVYDGIGKIIRLDGEGMFVEEVKQTAGRFFTLFGKGENGYYMQGQMNPPRGGPAGFKEIESAAHLVSLDGASSAKIVGFTSRVYEGPQFGMDWDNYLQVFNRKDGSLYVSHTCDYKVVRADIPERKIIAAFTREYRRTPFVVKDSEKDFYEKFNPPKKEFENDISALFVCGEDVWVKTSTTDRDKGVLFDVFDPQGRFLDSFFLPSGLNLRLAEGEFIYVTEKDEDENILLRKYRMLNGPKAPSMPAEPVRLDLGSGPPIPFLDGLLTVS